MSLARAAASIAANMVLFLGPSCGGTPPALQARAAHVDRATAAPVAPTPDLSAIADPPALVMWGRIAKPSASMSIVHEWTKLPMPQSERVAELATGGAVGPLVDLDLPIDFAIAVAGTGAPTHDRTAISVGLKDADRAKAALADRYKLVPGDNGVLLVQALGRLAKQNGVADDGDDDDPRMCELAPAYGASPVRLVCGRSAEALAELAPWLTRTLTRAPAVDDLRIDLRMRALRGTLSKDRRLLVMLLANGLGERRGWTHRKAASFAKEVADFALDLESLSLAVTMSESAATARFGFKLSGHASSLAHLVDPSPDTGLAASTAFWQLPADATLAGFALGTDSARLVPWRDFVMGAIGDDLAEIGVRDADRTAIADAVGRLMPSAEMAYACGIDQEAVRKALAAERSVGESAPLSERVEAKRRSVEALLGWHLIEVDQPAAQWIAGLKDLAVAWGRSGVAEAYRTGSNDRAPPLLHAAPMPRGVALPSGAQHYVLDFRAPAPALVAGAGSAPLVAKGSKVSNPIAIHILIAPDGARTWVAFAASDVVAASKLASATGGAAETLSARPELVGLKPPVALGGFVTLQGLVEAVQQAALVSGGSTQAAAQAFGEIASLPHQGAAPVSFFWGGDPRQASSLTPDPGAPSVLTVVVPRGAIEDAVTEILRRGGF